jgi:hypothetical protein
MSQIAIYRPQPLSTEDFRKLEAIAHDTLDIALKNVDELFWTTDEYGDRIQRKRSIMAGFDIAPKQEINPVLLESLKRQTTPRHTAVHLTRLAAHKPWGRGEEAFSVIVEDLARDLIGVSEWAIVKTCEHYRKDDTIKFFPDTAAFLRIAIETDRSLKNIAPKKNANSADRSDAENSRPQERTQRRKRRVTRMCKLALKPKDCWTRWEKRFFNAMGEKA